MLEVDKINTFYSGFQALADVSLNVGEGELVEITIGTFCDELGGFDLHRSETCAEVVRAERTGYGTGVALKFCGRFERIKPDSLMMPF